MCRLESHSRRTWIFWSGSGNSKTRLKVNEETGKALLWETIDNEAEKPVYAIIVDGVSDHGARYEEL